LRHVIQIRLTAKTDADDLALWTEVEAASRHSAEIAQAAQRMETEVMGNLFAVFAAQTGLNLPQAQQRYATTASFLLVMIKAASCLSCASPIDHEAVRAMILASIDQALDKVVP